MACVVQGEAREKNQVLRATPRSLVCCACSPLRACQYAQHAQSVGAYAMHTTYGKRQKRLRRHMAYSPGTYSA